MNSIVPSTYNYTTAENSIIMEGDYHQYYQEIPGPSSSSQHYYPEIPGPSSSSQHYYQEIPGPSSSSSHHYYQEIPGPSSSSQHYYQEIPGPSSSSSTGGIQLPPGYRFIPMDYELILHLQNKIRNGPILIEEIRDVDFYKNDPKTLSEMYPPLGEKEWYFFTSRNRKYPNGLRPDRSVGNGYWKATGADKKVYYKGETVGLKKSLVFYRGKHQDSVKTNWILHEFRIERIPDNNSRATRRDANDNMKLDDWVLCRIYEKAPKTRGNEQGNDNNVTDVATSSAAPIVNRDENAPVINHNENGGGAFEMMDDEELMAHLRDIDSAPSLLGWLIH